MAVLSFACASTTVDHGDTMHAEHVAGGGHDWRAEPHHVSVLLGGTTDDEEAAFTIGLDYEYRATDLIGVGARDGSR